MGGISNPSWPKIQFFSTGNTVFTLFTSLATQDMVLYQGTDVPQGSERLKPALLVLGSEAASNQPNKEGTQDGDKATQEATY